MAETEPTKEAPLSPTQTPAKESTEKFTLEILNVAKTSQLQNGLRHGDYMRYRQYCTRRLRRIRKSLKFLHGKNKFQKKTIEPKMVTDPRYLLMALVKAERCWSYYMELKDESAENPRCRVHMHRRLAKAVKYAKDLELLCTEKADQKTVLEAEAYLAWLSGTLLMERESWEESLSFFLKARTIYEQLGKISSVSQERFKEKVEEIEPSIRYCNYNLKGSDSSKASESAETRLKSGASMDQLKAKLDNVLSETMKKQAESSFEIPWKGKKIAIKNEKVRLALVAANEADYELQQADSLDKKLSLYDKLFISYNDAIRIIKDDITDITAAKNKSMKVESQEEGLQLLKNYVSFLKLSKTEERNILLAESFDAGLPSIGGGAETKSNEAPKKRTKPEDVVRIYENLIQNMTEMAELRGDEIEAAKEIAAKLQSFKALRCFYMSLSYLYASKWREAMALLDRAVQQLKSARAHYEACAVVNQDLMKRLKETEGRIRGLRCEAHARGFLQYVKEKTAQTELTEVKKEENSSGNLLANMKKFDASFVKNKELIAFPPNFEAIKCKSLLFDLALGSCDFPSLEARKKSKSGFFGFWR